MVRRDVLWPHADLLAKHEVADEVRVAVLHEGVDAVLLKLGRVLPEPLGVQERPLLLLQQLGLVARTKRRGATGEKEEGGRQEGMRGGEGRRGRSRGGGGGGGERRTISSETWDCTMAASTSMAARTSGSEAA